jgi:hypothetical protein
MEVKNRYSIKINGKQKKNLYKILSLEKELKKLFLPDGELNPGLPRDRRGY